MSYDADVIIIGAGHNSLTAALYLLDAGRKVLLLERSSEPGGAVKSGEILEPGFVHDLYATNIGLFMGSKVYADYKDDLHRNGFEPLVNQLPYANAFPGGKCLRVYTDAAKTSEEFKRFAPEDAKAFEQMIGYFGEVAPLIFPILQTPMPSMTTFRHFWKMYRKLRADQLADLVRVLLMPSRGFVDEWFTSDEAKALLTPWAYHLGLSPDCAGGATFSFLEAAVDHLNGMALSKGGAGNLIKALVKTVEDKGGRILTSQEVNEIKVKKGAVAGVKTADGQELTAKHGVMASITPHQIIKLVSDGELPSDYVKKCRNFRFGPGTLMVHLTLDKPLQWEAAEDLTDFAYVHLGPYMSDIATTNHQVKCGLLPSSPLLVVAQQSRIDPSRAPEGKSTLWIQARAYPHNPVGDSMDEIKTGDWDAMKEQIGMRILDKVAVYAPTVKDHIRKMTVHTPQDLEKDNPTLVGGDMVGGSHHIEQNFFLRPFGGWSRYKTPIKRLYMIGHSTWPGGGLNATSGHLGAMQLLKGK